MLSRSNLYSKTDKPNALVNLTENTKDELVMPFYESLILLFIELAVPPDRIHFDISFIYFFLHGEKSVPKTVRKHS